MNSLEFIEKEIANIREFLELDDVLCIQTDKDYKFLYDRLKILQQIKTELEAWEVVKKHLEYFPDDYWNGIPEEIITMTSKIDKKDYPIIKKALEVTNETRK